MITIPGKIPIIIRPVFWLFSCFYRFYSEQKFYRNDLFGCLSFLVSVIVHELGHATTYINFRSKTDD